jgi:hypothetical protein
MLVILNCVLRGYSHGHWPPQVSLIFWRALCEAGIGFRFVLQPAFNLYICHAYQCTRETGGKSASSHLVYLALSS